MPHQTSYSFSIGCFINLTHCFTTGTTYARKKKALAFSVHNRNISECHKRFLSTLNHKRNCCYCHISLTFRSDSRTTQKPQPLVQSCCTCVKILNECSKTIFQKLKSCSLTDASVAISTSNCSKRFLKSVPSSGHTGKKIKIKMKKKKYPPGWETSECSEKHLLTTLKFPQPRCVRLDMPRHVMQDSVQYIGSGDKWHHLTAEEQAHLTLLGTHSKTDYTNLVLCVWFDTLVLTHHLSLNSKTDCAIPLQMITNYYRCLCIFHFHLHVLYLLPNLPFMYAPNPHIPLGKYVYANAKGWLFSYLMT